MDPRLRNGGLGLLAIGAIALGGSAVAGAPASSSTSNWTAVPAQQSSGGAPADRDGDGKPCPGHDGQGNSGAGSQAAPEQPTPAPGTTPDT